MVFFIKRLLIFVLSVCIFYPLLIVLWGAVVPDPYKQNLIYQPNVGHLDKRMADLKTTNQVDVLFLGSSHAYRGFDSRIFSKAGFSSFNLGSSAQTHLQTHYFIKNYLPQLDPQLVIYEVYPEMFETQGVESGVNLVSVASPLNKEIIKQVVALNNIKVYNTYIFNLLNRKLGLGISTSKEQEGKYIEGGYVEFDKIYMVDNPPTSHKWNPAENQLEKFEENISFLQEKRIPYILVITPFLFEHTNESEILDYLKSKGHVINYNKVMEFNKQDFSDYSHINQFGVEKLNNHLIKIIRREYLKPEIKGQKK